MEDSKAVIGVLAIQELAHSFEKFAFIVANKDVSKCWAKRGIQGHTIKLPENNIVKIEVNCKCSHYYHSNKHCINSNIHITKPNKGSEVAINHKNEYITELTSILQDSSEFETLGPSADFDKTAKIEAQIQRLLLQLEKTVSSDLKPTINLNDRFSRTTDV